MSDLSMVIDPGQQRELERFYFYEARLLDGREYQQWLTLVDPEIRYLVPSRVNVQVDNRKRGSELMISVDSELEGPESMGCPVREENYIHLMVRVERAFKINSWSENPPARTRRIVGNIELMQQEENALTVLSNFHLYYDRPGAGSYRYSGQGRDLLLQVGEGFRIREREVVLDYADIAVPTLGLLF